MFLCRIPLSDICLCMSVCVCGKKNKSGSVYAGDCGEPPHIHVESNDNIAKFWIDPVIFESSRGFGRKEINRIQKLVEKYQEILLRGWNEFFND